LGLLPFPPSAFGGKGVVLDRSLLLITRAFPYETNRIFVIPTDVRLKKQFIDWALSRGLNPENVQSPIFTAPDHSQSQQDVVVFMHDYLLLPTNFDLRAFLSSLQVGNSGDIPPIILLDQELAKRQYLHQTVLLSRSDYDAALLANPTISNQSPPQCIEESCPARIGLMGNPSDGFEGKTLSFLLENFAASVVIKAPEPPLSPTTVHLEPHPELDPFVFGDAGSFALHTTLHGYYGGLRLVQAACQVFTRLCMQSGNCAAVLSRGFVLRYSTTIPRMVGLSGSSAIIIATFRGLLRYYGLSLCDLGLTRDEMPTVMLDVERRELGISAGLQDRVIQTFGGLVHMDFGPEAVRRKRETVAAASAASFSSAASLAATSSLIGGDYTLLSPSMLPPLYLAYNVAVGGDSGKVHSTVRDRWAAKEPTLIAGMQALAGYADEALLALQQGDASRLAAIMRLNFSMRRSLYGDAVVGLSNIAMIERAESLGLSAKFTGSGGALVCARSDGQGWLDVAQEESAVATFAEHNFKLVRVRPSNTIFSYS